MLIQFVEGLFCGVIINRTLTLWSDFPDDLKTSLVEQSVEQTSGWTISTGMVLISHDTASYKHKSTPRVRA